MMNRRQFLDRLAAMAAFTAVPIHFRPATAQEQEWRHGMSTFGDLALPADFTHFPFVEPKAIKGGKISLQIAAVLGNQAFNTFNTLNPFSDRGDGAAGAEALFASLMVGSGDEPDSLYGEAAEAVRMSADRRTFWWRLRPGLTFHDGAPITAEDVAFSFELMSTKGHPRYRLIMNGFERAVAEDVRVVRVEFNEKAARDLPLFIAGLPIFSKAYYTANDFTASTLTPPVGSGGVKVGRFEQGRFIEYERIADWWGTNLPVNVGQSNFNVVRYEYYRDRDVAFEAFKSGEFLFREEFTSRIWATGYDFPARQDGRVKRDELPDERPSGAQGWFINTRREKFADRRVREALAHCFDFEWTNRNLMFNSFKRTTSFFENSDLKATGLPSPEELALLEPWRGKVPEEVFGIPWEPPAADGTGQDRTRLREALRLMTEAGFSFQNGVMRDTKGQPFTIEFLDDDGGLERHTGGYIAILKRLGIEATFRIVDAPQYESRLNDFDFDMTVRRYSLGLNPGGSEVENWTSRSADVKGSYNLAGIKDPAIDALAEAVKSAKTRAELVVACRAIDRVVRSGRYWVPQWYKASHWIAYWDVFQRPPGKPRFALGAPGTWWIDEAKAKALGKGL